MTYYSETLLKRQIELEEESVSLGIKRYREQIATTPVSEMPPGLALMYRTIEPMATAVDDFVNVSRRGGGRMHQARDFLRNLDPYDVAFITSKQLLNHIATARPIQNAGETLFDVLADHIEYQKMLKDHPNYLDTIERRLNKVNSGTHHRRATILHAKRHGLGIADSNWSNVDKVHVGVKLIELFIESTGLVERVQGETSQWLLQGTQEALEWIIKHNAKCELLSPVFMPMIVPPVPWESIYGGGYIMNNDTMKIKLVKTRNRDALEALENHEMPEVYNAVNTLQNVPWRVNRAVLEVLQEVHRLDNGLAGLPRIEEIPLPPTPWTTDAEYEYMLEHKSGVVKDWKASAREVYERRISEKSKAMQLAHKLWLADKFKSEERIYYVWTLDWRGRMYPVAPFLNPQGDDIAKALLEFASGKPLGERGVYWLKVHLANCFGVDKVSFDDRIKWVDEHKDLIVDSAVDPVGGLRFWAEADDPWEFLAGCFEYYGYTLEGESFVSHLPIAMDGSCNGLQNFSAMLLDEVGGKATNLVPVNYPQDVYTEVMHVVIKHVDYDAEHGEDEETREYARVWQGKIDRNIVKRPVMTVPYGVKLFGIKDQLVEELRKRPVDYLDCDDPYKPAMYLAKVLWWSIGEVVIASRSAMDWLQETAGIVSKYAGGAITWTTPQGFLVYQKYPKQTTKKIRTYWGEARLRVQLSVNSETHELDKIRQRNGISPNFVHSMDASHLMSTVNRLEREGIKSFVGIHDSYATHACDTDKLHRVLRQAFVDQYSVDVLQDFKEQVERTHLQGILDSKGRPVMLPKVPPKGRLRLTDVLDSKYFFA